MTANVGLDLPALADTADRRAKRPSFGRRAFVLDVAMLAVTVLAVELLSPTASPTGGVPREPIGWLLAFCVLVLVLFKVRGLYEPPLRLEFTETLRLVLTGTALAAIVAMAGRVLAANHPYVAAETLRHWLLALVFVTLGRALLLSMETRGRATHGASRRTLVVGAGKVGHVAASRLLSDPTLGLRPVAFLDDNPLDVDDGVDLPIHRWDEFEQVVEEQRIEHAIIAFSGADHAQLLALIRGCWACGVAVSVVPRLFEIKGGHVAIEHLGGLPLFRLDPTDPQGWQFRLKYALDRVVGGALLLFLLPLLLVAMLAVLVSLGRPIFYRQLRVGRDGQVFEMLKLRSLRHTNGGEQQSEETDAPGQHGSVPRLPQIVAHVVRQRPGADARGLIQRVGCCPDLFQRGCSSDCDQRSVCRRPELNRLDSLEPA